MNRGDHVPLAANSKEWVAACLAEISAGAVVVPLDAQLDDEALRHVLDDSGARHVFTTADQADVCGAWMRGLRVEDHPARRRRRRPPQPAISANEMRMQSYQRPDPAMWSLCSTLQVQNAPKECH